MWELNGIYGYVLCETNGSPSPLLRPLRLVFDFRFPWNKRWQPRQRLHRWGLNIREGAITLEHLGTSWNKDLNFRSHSTSYEKKTSLPDSSWQLEPMSLFSLLDLKAVFDALHLCALQSEKVAASSWSPSYSLGEIERHSWYSWLVA
jgi:hypothetical protein